MKRGTLIVILMVAVVIYLIFRAKKAQAAVTSPSEQPVGSPKSQFGQLGVDTSKRAVDLGFAAGAALIDKFLKTGQPATVNVGPSASWSEPIYDSGGVSSPDFSQGAYSGMGGQGTMTFSSDYY